jgi:hypothetical protein
MERLFAQNGMSSSRSPLGPYWRGRGLACFSSLAFSIIAKSIPSLTARCKGFLKGFAPVGGKLAQGLGLLVGQRDGEFLRHGGGPSSGSFE